eukprot:g5289.t1
MSSLSNEVKSALSTFSSQLSSLENGTTLMTSMMATNEEDTESHLSPLDKARFNFTLAYALNSAFFMFLKTRGINPNIHPVKEQMKRAQRYATKIDKVANPEKYKRKREVEEEKARDAKRIKTAAISSQSFEKRVSKKNSDGGAKKKRTPTKGRKKKPSKRRRK